MVNYTKRALTAILMLPMLLLGSCIRDEAPEGGGAGFGNRLQLTVKVAKAGIQAATRSTVAPLPGEEDVTVLYLLFFEADANDNGQFIDYVRIDNISPDTSTSIDISGHPSLAVSGEYDILAVANIDDNSYINGSVSTWIQGWQGMTLNQVKTSATAWVKGSTDNSNAIASDRLLMTGSIEKSQGQYDLALVLNRGVIRFDVYNNKSESHDLVSAELWNVYPSNSLWGGGAADDYSSSVARIGRYYGVDNSGNSTGVAGADGLGDTVGNILGGLYCFENRVITPSQNDALTTCIIVGLRERATGITGYHRVNINPDKSSQVLLENSAYRLTIRDIDAGSATSAAAYAAAEGGPDYIINYWDMSDYGLIMIDGNSILSIPTKTIIIPEDGGDFSYDIFTFNNTGSTSKLTIESQRYEPSNGSISSVLNGNTLTVHATPLGAGESSRTGTVVLTYAGLEGAVNIIQSRGEDVFLRVYLPSDGMRPLAPYAGIASGDIRVDASGPWTAEIFMPDEGFTLDPAILSPQIATTMLHSTDPLASGNRFKVYTWSANPELVKRECFVVVSLDSDPENHAAVVQLSQEPSGVISLVPNNTSVIFNGMGTGLAAVAGNTTDTFNVHPSMESDGGEGEQIAEWTYKKMPSGEYDDTAMFDVVNMVYDPADMSANTITAAAVGQNMSGRRYTATLRIFLTLDETVYTDLQLVQQTLGVSLSPGTLPAVDVDGGRTSPITVIADESLTWSAALVSDCIAGTDGRTVVHHEARLVDQYGNPITPGTQYPMSTQICVEFPKTYYPNRGTLPRATVTVTVEGMQAVVTVLQSELMAKPLAGYGMTGYPAWGGLGDTYDAGWEGTSGTYGLKQIPGYIQYAAVDISSTAPVPNAVYYLHVVPTIAGAAGTNYDWAVVNGFMSGVDGLALFGVDDTSAVAPVNNASSPFKAANYPDVIYDGGLGYSQVVESDTKLYHFVMDQGNTPLEPADITSAFMEDTVNTYYDTSQLPPTAIVLMGRTSDPTHATLIVDIQNKFIYRGCAQAFWNSTYLTNNRGVFLDNLMYYIANAAKYGTNFTDLLLEDDQPGAQPPPWDTDYWGANAGVTK